MRPTVAGLLAALLALASLGLASCEERSLPLDGPPSEGLVFVRGSKGSHELARGRLADGAVRRVRGAPGATHRWPFWSQEARRLVFQAGPHPLRTRLVSFDPEAGSFRALVKDPARHQNWPVWSPGGRWLAYAFRGAPQDPARGLAVAQIATAERRVLAASTRSRGVFVRPEWDPEGRSLVVQRRRDGRSELWLLGRDGGERRRILEAPEGGTDSKARFTREGAWIVFTRRARPKGPGDLHLVRPDGTELRRIASKRGADEHSARPSPVRDEIVFVSDRYGTRDLFRATIPDGPLRRLTATPERIEATPRWSPDGERIVFIAAPSDAPEDWHVTAVDREGRVLFEAPGVMADWMPPWR